MTNTENRKKYIKMDYFTTQQNTDHKNSIKTTRNDDQTDDEPKFLLSTTPTLLLTFTSHGIRRCIGSA